MKNFIEVISVDKKSIYAININNICRFYPVSIDDKDFVKAFYDNEKINLLSSIVSEDVQKTINDTRNSIEKANCIIELNTSNDEDYTVYTINTYNEITLKVTALK